MQIYVSFYTFSNKEQIFFGSADYFGGADSSGVLDVSDEFSQESILYNKEIAGKNVGDFFGDPPGARTQDPHIKSVMLYLLS